jgi:hypothetical protein
VDKCSMRNLFFKGVEKKSPEMMEKLESLKEIRD